MTSRTFALSAALCAAISAVAPQAFAFETTSALDRLKALVAEQGFDMAWTAATPQDDDIVLDGVSFALAGDPERVTVGQVTLTDVTEEDDDIIRIGSMSLPSFETTSPDGSHLAITEIVAEGIDLAGPATTDELTKLGIYEGMSVGKLEIDKAGAKMATMQDFAMTVDRTDTGGLTFEGGVDTLSIDMTQSPDQKTKDMMAAFGYNTLSGGVTLSGGWDPVSGKTTLDDYSFTVDDAGTLGMTLDLSGYTLAIAKQLRDASKKMNAPGMTEEQKSAQGLALLGMLQGLTFASATIRFDDDGLTQKALDYAGKQQGMTAVDAANQTKAVVPFMLAQLQNPEFSAQVSAAVNAFIDNPKSIEIAAKPATPQPFAMLLAAGMGDPKMLITTLGVTVKANE
ncbi:MAG: hypothetical protein IPL47_14265 [Phyllobacteriaceae bacterium]|nr:hypothetical protein [Phyllobacteriaceae bacterium]